jgi:hypothetical protein
MLSEYFADEREAIRFMREHASCTIVIPSIREVEQLAAGRQIVQALERDPSTNTMNRLHEIHEMEKRYISKIYCRATGRSLASRRAELAAQAANSH